MKKIMHAFLIAVLICAAHSAFSEPQTKYKGKGEALILNDDLPKAKKEALNHAFKNAIQKAVGVYIKSQSKVEDFELTYNKILSESEGYISEYTVKKEYREDNIYYVEIEAVISGDKLETAFSRRISKLIENNPFGPSGMMTLVVSRYNTFNMIQFNFYCPVNDPTIEKKFIEFRFPATGWFKPNIMEYGIYKSIQENVMYQADDIKAADTSVTPLKFYRDVVHFLKNGGKEVKVKFKNPSSGKIEEKSVVFDQATIMIIDNIERPVNDGKPYISVQQKKLEEIGAADMQKIIRYFESLNDNIIRSKKQ